MTRIAGMRVLVPGAEKSSAELIRLLDAAGACPEGVPLIAIGAPPDPAALDRAAHALSTGHYHWVSFMSVNAVDAVLRSARSQGLEPAVAAQTRVASVGPATSAALDRAGVSVALQPHLGAGAQQLAEIWPESRPSAERVLLPASAIGLPTLAEALWRKGYAVDRVTAYDTVQCPVPNLLRDRLRGGEFGAVLLASPSAATTLAAQVTLPPATIVGCIGETTAAAAHSADLRVTFTAGTSTAAGLVESLTATVAEGAHR